MLVLVVLMMREEKEKGEGGDDSLSGCAAFFWPVLVRDWIRWLYLLLCVFVGVCLCKY